MKKKVFVVLTIMLLSSMLASSYVVQLAGSVTDLVGYWKFDEDTISQLWNFDIDASGWTPFFGNWTVHDGVYEVIGDPARDNWGGSTAGEPYWENYTMEAKVMSFPVAWAYDMGIGVRTTRDPLNPDNITGYSFAIHPGSDAVLLDKYINGVRTTLASLTEPIDTEVWYNMTLDVKGNNITAWLNGTQKFSVIDNDIPSGKIELGGKGKVQFDYVKVTSEDVAIDSSGNDNHGIIYGATSVDGKIGKALDFDGVDDYVQITDSPSLSPITGITIKAWIKLNAVGSNWQTISIKEGPEGRAWWFGFFPNESNRIHWSNGGLSTWDLSCYIPSALNTWRHIVVTYQSGGIGRKIYVDGELICSDTATGDLFDTSGSVYIGPTINATIDEVKIYNRALSNEEIKNQYLGLVGYWKFDEGSGNIAYDSSGNGNDGTLVNGPVWVDGRIGKALRFDGIDDYVNVPHHSSLNPSVLTVMAWVNPFNTTGNRNVVFKGDHQYAMQLRNGKILFGSRNSTSGYSEFLGSLIVPENTWTHIAVTHDGSIRKIYVNGLLDPVTSSQSGLFTGDTNSLKMGTHLSLLTEFFNGTIDEVRIYNRALSEEEIRALAQVGITQLGLTIDGSGSISSSDFTIIKNEVAEAVRNNMPHDGTAELTVVQFGDNIALVEIPPTIVNETNFESIATDIEGISQIGSLTPMADGLYLTWETMKSSPNFATATRQLINVATDGFPNVVLQNITSPTGDARNDTTWVRDTAAGEGLDEIDAEAIGSSPDLNWMRDYLVYPQPGTIAPPYTPGWVEWVENATEFAAAIGQKFERIFYYPVANFTESAHSVTIGETITFDASASYDPDGYIVSYDWDFGDGTNATGVSVTHSYSAEGNYTVTLTVTDNDGLTGTATATKTVEPIVDWWPMFHHDLRNTGYSTSTAPNTNNIVWNYTIGAPVGSSPAVINGKVFVGAKYNYGVYALNATNGALIWNHTTGGHVLSSPAVVDGVVFVGCWDGNVYALNETSGALIWNHTTGIIAGSSPAVTDGRVYIGAESGLFALNETTGTLIWKYSMFRPWNSSPAVVDGMVFIGAQDGNVYAVNATDGTLIWKYTTGGMVNSSPAVVDGMVFIGSDDKNVYALNETTGSFIWKYTTGGYVQFSPAIADEMVFITSQDSKIYALNKTTGSHIWNYSWGEWGYSPAVADGKVFVSLTSGSIHVLNETNGSYIWSYAVSAWNVPTGSPAVADGKVFFGSSDGNVYAFGPAVNQLPVADANGPYTGTEGSPITFDGSGSYDPDGTIVSYEWNFGDGNTGPGVNPTHTYTQDGTYTITLTVTDDLGATDTGTTTATIGDTEPTADFSGTPTSGYEPLTVGFTDLSTSYDGITSWEWDFDNNGVIDSTIQNPTHVYNQEGIYTVTLSVQEADGDSDSKIKVNYITVTVPTGVGGITIPVNKLGLLAPYIGLTSTIIAATVATAIYVKRVKRRKEKQ